MTKNKQIRVVANKPFRGQDGIGQIIGKTYNLNKIVEMDDGRKCAQISCLEFGGIVLLNPGEFEFI